MHERDPSRRQRGLLPLTLLCKRRASIMRRRGLIKPYLGRGGTSCSSMDRVEACAAGEGRAGGVVHWRAEKGRKGRRQTAQMRRVVRRRASATGRGGASRRARVATLSLPPTTPTRGNHDKSIREHGARKQKVERYLNENPNPNTLTENMRILIRSDGKHRSVNNRDHFLFFYFSL